MGYTPGAALCSHDPMLPCDVGPRSGADATVDATGLNALIALAPVCSIRFEALRSACACGCGSPPFKERSRDDDTEHL